jgi:hypothetical protein
VWDLERGVLRKTIPVFETVEAVGLVDVPEGSAAEVLPSSDAPWICSFVIKSHRRIDPLSPPV